MKKIFTTMLAGIMVLSLTACDENSYNDDLSDGIGGVFDDIFGEDSSTSSKVSGWIDEIFGSEDNESKDTTTFSLTMSGIEFTIPSTFEERSDSTETCPTFEYAPGRQTRILFFLEEENPISQEEFYNINDELVSYFYNTESETIKEIKEILYPKDILIADMPAKSFAFTCVNQYNVTMTAQITYIHNANNNKMLGVFLTQRADNSFLDDYNQIIESAKIVSDNTMDQEGTKNSEEEFDIDKDLTVVMCDRDDKYTSMYNIVFAEYNQDGVPINFYAFDSYDGCINPRAMGKNFNAIGGLPSWFYVGATVHVKANLSGSGLSTLNCSVTPG